MTKFLRRKRVWEVVIISLIIVSVIMGIFLYHNFFRQKQAYLIETVPPNAIYLLQINDNEKFMKEIPQLLPYLNELLSLSSVPGLEFFIDKLSIKQPALLLSGHSNGVNTKLLLSSSCSELDFTGLLSKLKIDERNFINFEGSKIYSFGTHLKKFYFSFNNNVFTISEDIELLKKSIVQHKYPKNMLSDKKFAGIYHLVTKNEKQNWLLLHNARFFEMNLPLFSKQYQHLIQSMNIESYWSAFQIRFGEKEIVLSGYIAKKVTYMQKFENQETNTELPTKIIPFSSLWYMSFNLSDYSKFIKYFSTSSNPAVQSAIKDFDIFKPNAIYSFAIAKDTSELHFMAIKKDTINFKQEDLLPDSMAQRAEFDYKNHKIYRSGLLGFEKLLTIFQEHSSFNYFTEYQNYYIFSDSISSLQIYYNDILQHNIGGLPLYRFVRSNLPSQFAQEFCILFPDQSTNESMFFTNDHDFIDTKKRGTTFFLFIF
ncbi:MAG: hypothetical protein LBU51_07965 [Bacteroidales bacterium]|jgi:hypothetical protein|nr:hypothetical protein [Bacteroidales bacterium]